MIMPSAPKSIARVSTVQAVADDVRTRVLDGEFAPGTQLREADLVDQYQVARHCVRSALHQLSHEGLLRHQPNHGVFVPEAERDAVVDVLVARAAIEVEALRRVILGDRPVAEIVAAAGSERLQQFHNSLLAESQMQLAFLDNKEEQRDTIRPNHRELIAALVARDLGRASELLRKDLGEPIGEDTL